MSDQLVIDVPASTVKLVDLELAFLPAYSRHFTWIGMAVSVGPEIVKTQVYGQWIGGDGRAVLRRGAPRQRTVVIG